MQLTLQAPSCSSVRCRVPMALPSRPLFYRPRHFLAPATASLAMPVPQPLPNKAVGSVAAPSTQPEEDVLRVTTVHSPEELQSVIDANKEKLVVLMAKAKGCRPCKLFARKYARAAALYSDAVFLEIFGDESKDTRALMIKMAIKVTPTFVLYRGGERVHSHGGVQERNLHKAIQAHLQESEAGYGVTVLQEESDEE